MFFWVLCFPPQDIPTGAYAKLSLGVNKCVNVCVHCVLQWTCVPIMACVCLAPSIPGIESWSTKTLTKDERLNECINILSSFIWKMVLDSRSSKLVSMNWQEHLTITTAFGEHRRLPRITVVSSMICNPNHFICLDTSPKLFKLCVYMCISEDCWYSWPFSTNMLLVPNLESVPWISTEND